MMKLTDRKWMPFYIGDIFDKIDPGKAKGHNHLTHDAKGVSYIGATNRNNGVLDFVKLTSALQAGNAIGFIKNGNGVGSAGHAIYKAGSFISTSDVIYGYAKWLNRYVGLFFTTCSDMNESKFSHGYKWTPERIKRSLVTLPVCKDDANQPDFAFMEAFVKERANALLAHYNAFAEGARSSRAGGQPLKPLSEVIWKAFLIREIFPEIKRGKRLKTADHTPGEMPYVSSSAMNNGVDDFIGNEKRVRIFRDCLTLANSGSVGSCFYHAYAFVASDHVTHLKCAGLSPFQYLFVSVMCSKLSDKYNFNREINDRRIARETIMLPATSRGKPDFAYMEAYGRKIVRECLAKYLAHCAP